MNFIAWVTTGTIVGWLASYLIKIDRRDGALESIAMGIVGALFGGQIIGPLANGATLDQIEFSFISLILSFVGSIGLLAVVEMLRRSSLHH